MGDNKIPKVKTESEVSTPAIDEIINNVAGNATLGDVWALFQYRPGI